MRGAKKAETKSESKYVSCFADSKPDVDITFRDVLLTRPADHYLVGIDNFSLTNSTLSMIEPHISGDYETFFRIVRNLEILLQTTQTLLWRMPPITKRYFLETGNVFEHHSMLQGDTICPSNPRKKY